MKLFLDSQVIRLHINEYEGTKLKALVVISYSASLLLNEHLEASTRVFKLEISKISFFYVSSPK